MENTAIQAIKGELSEGETSVGAEIFIEHLRASKVGETLTATAEMKAHEGSSIFIQIEVKNERNDLIGRAKHARGSRSRKIHAPAGLNPAPPFPPNIP